MNHADFNFVVGEFFNRRFERFDRTLNVGFDDDIKILHLAFFDLAEHVVERDFLSLLSRFVLDLCGSFGNDLFSRLFVFDYENSVAGVGYVGKSEYRNGRRGSSLFYASALVVHHAADSAAGKTRNDVIADVKRTVKYDDVRDGTFSFGRVSIR